MQGLGGGFGGALQAPANNNAKPFLGNVPARSEGYSKVIINNNGTPIAQGGQEERRNANGTKDLILTVNSQIAKQIADPYSYASGPLAARGAKAQVKRR